jgi:PAS domain-containing protein
MAKGLPTADLDALILLKRQNEKLQNQVAELQQRNELLQKKIDECEQDLKDLQESDERLNALMRHNPSLIFLKDEEGRYIYLNAEYEEQFVGSKNWFGKTDFDLWPKESAELFRANDAEVLRSEVAF